MKYSVYYLLYFTYLQCYAVPFKPIKKQAIIKADDIESKPPNYINQVQILAQRLSTTIDNIQPTPEVCVQKAGKWKCPKLSKKTSELQKDTGTISTNLLKSIPSASEHFRSAEDLFTNISKTFSSVKDSLLETAIEKVMRAVIDNTNNQINQFEQTINKLNNRIEQRLIKLEELIRLLPTDKPRLLPTEHNESPQLAIAENTKLDSIDVALAEKYQNSGLDSVKAKVSGTDVGTSSVDVGGSCARVNFTDLLSIDLRRSDSQMKSEEEEEGFSLRTKSSGNHHLLQFVLACICIVVVACVLLTSALWWLWGELLTEHSHDSSPFLMNLPEDINRFEGYTPASLTVISLTDQHTMHTQVQLIVGGLIRSDSADLNTIFHQMAKDMQKVLVGGVLGGERSGRLLVFIDINQTDGEKADEDGRGEMYGWKSVVTDRIKNFSLNDICGLLGDVIVVIYGDGGSHKLQRGAIYNKTVVEALPLPSVRALCRVGRLFTINTAFTNTQSLLLKHWLQSPAKVYEQ